MALIQMTFASDALKMNMEATVLLPENAGTLIGMETRAEGRCPVLYLLHGMTDDHTIWERRTSIERYAAGLNLAIVMPEGHLGWYTDMQVGPKYFTYIADELPRLCQSMFPQISPRREDTFVAGLSMGGYGALKCGLRRPDVFSRAAGLSSAADILSSFQSRDSSRRQMWRDIFGNEKTAVAEGNDLFTLASKPADSACAFFMWCGTDDGLYDANERLRRLMQKNGYDLVWSDGPGGHSWDRWDEQIRNVLAWLPLGGKEV
ncbi:MAG: esterase family protein [Clostridia bacterium]|nr:esterase family protein [Clostridia bacterium]